MGKRSNGIRAQQNRFKIIWLPGIFRKIMYWIRRRNAHTIPTTPIFKHIESKFQRSGWKNRFGEYPGQSETTSTQKLKQNETWREPNNDVLEQLTAMGELAKQWRRWPRHAQYPLRWWMMFSIIILIMKFDL